MSHNKITTLRKFTLVFFRIENGAISIEAAITLPIFLFAILGGIDLINFVQTSRQMDTVVSSVADLAARANPLCETSAEPNGNEIGAIFAAAERISGKFNLEEQGAVILTGIERRNNGDIARAWQEKSPYGKDTFESRLTFQGGRLIGAPQNILRDAGDTLISAEVFYRKNLYTLGGGLVDQVTNSSNPSYTIYRRAFYRSRFAEQPTIRPAESC